MPRDQSKKAAVKLGLAINEPGRLPGLHAPEHDELEEVYLIDNEGRVVHTWKPEYNSMHCCYLLPNGHLLRPADLGGARTSFGGGPGACGRVQEFTWDGELVWDFTFFNDKQLPHHDVCKMPNGNVLMIVWDKKTVDECDRRRPQEGPVSKYLLPDSVVEVKPTGKTTGEVVWEWHLWDHLVQDHDSTKANFGDVADHPELVDVNFVEDASRAPDGPEGRRQEGRGRQTSRAGEEQGRVDKLKSIGYAGSAASQAQRVNPDWTHVNSVDYNAELDQIVLSVHEFSEIWIIDHSTTKAEAAGHTGGRSGKGGDLLYRWGNPRVYRAGTAGRPDSSSPSTTPTGSPRACRARGTSSSSTTARGRPDGDLLVGRRARPAGR